MGRDVGHRQQSSYFSGCYTMSPSCFPVQEEIGYSRIHYYSKASDSDKIRRRWRNLLRRLKDGKRSIYRSSSKPLSFHYDAVSYSQNFDEGCHNQESGHLPSTASR
ncbi:hypothetical protein GQ457_04G034890 [Hibiscus cannabinus]